jgi:hypothetical protein
MKVLKGDFGKKESMTVPEVFDIITKKEKLEEYKDAFCFIRSDDYVFLSTNMDIYELYFLLEQLKMTLITDGEYEI